MNHRKTNLRLAVIGFGVSARMNHLPAIATSNTFELAAIVDPFNTNSNVRRFESITELQQSDLRIDAVSLCMPPSDRLAHTTQCLEAGWHVLLEKPPVSTAEDLGKLHSLVSTTNCSIFATWHSAENPAVDAAAQWLESRPVERLQVTWLEHFTDWHPNQKWLWREPGFGVFDAGINAFSILSRILPDSLSAIDIELHVPKNAETPAAANLGFSLESKPIGTAKLDLLFSGKPIWEISILSGDSALLLTDGGHCLTIDGETVPTEGLSEYDRIYDRFANLIDQSQSSVETRPVELVLDILSRGKTVTVPPVDFDQR